MEAEQMMVRLLAEIRTNQAKMDTNLKKRKASQKEAANKQRSKYLD
jgi:hypothetical protein